VRYNSYYRVSGMVMSSRAGVALRRASFYVANQWLVVRLRVAGFLEALALRIGGVNIHIHRCTGLDSECPCWTDGYEYASNR